MTSKATQKKLTKAERQVRRLYALVWFLACPLIFVIVRLLGFTQINIVYWTLLIIPVLLAVYNVKQVPPSNAALGHTAKAPLPPDTDKLPADDVQQQEQSAEPGVSVTPVQRAKMIAVALGIPLVIFIPILLTLIVDIIIRISK